MKKRGRSLMQAGQAAVEFGLIGMIFFGLMCGIVDFGRGIWHYNVLSNAVREGARYGSVLHVTNTGVITAPDCAGVRDQVRDLSLGLNPNLTNGNIGVAWGNYTNNGNLIQVAPGTCDNTTTARSATQDLTDVPYYVTVSATFNFQLITPIIGNVIEAATGHSWIPLRSDAMMVTSY